MTLSSLIRDDVAAGVAAAVETFGRGAVGPDVALREAGFTSIDVVNLMLEVEERFDLRIPAARMTPANFRTPRTIEALVRALRPA